MKFLFKPSQSKIHEFLLFPKFLYHKKFFLEASSLNNYKQAIDPHYFDLLDEYQRILSPYEKEIELFYLKGFGELEFIDFLIRQDLLTSYQRPEDYLLFLANFDEHKIKQYLIDGLNEESEEESKLMIDSSSEQVSKFLENLELEPQAKWNLLMIIQNPLVYLNRYILLMREVLPLFNKAYEPFIKEVEEYGFYLQDYLNSHHDKGLEELSNAIITDKFLLEKENHLLVSPLFAYTVIVSHTTNKSRVIWGLKIQEVMKKIKEINADKLNERLQVFKYLGDKTKYEVLKNISRGITSTKELARISGVSSATISYHINVFLTARIIVLDNSNRKFSYIVNYDLLKQIIDDFKNDLTF